VTLQEGIYHRSGARPGAFFGIAFLRAVGPRDQLADGLGALWTHYGGLKRGELPQLAGLRVPDGGLTVLIGYGPKLFERADITVAPPPELDLFGRFRSPEAAGGGLMLVGSDLRYGADVAANPATEDVVVQFIADTQLAVTRAIVETWRSLRGAPSPLSLHSTYTGYQRDDQRSWLDFHDGVSNLRSADRPGVIEIKPAGDPQLDWTAGGTYLSFIRLAIDLGTWSGLPRLLQERLVGRDLVSGAALVGARGSANLTVAGCPVAGTAEVTEEGNEAFREPPVVQDRTLLVSHVQRSNHHVPNPSDPSSLRIYRQGYEFLEQAEQPPGFRAGLNFVSFTDTPQRLSRLLTIGGWLGETNFGGSPKRLQPALRQLLSVRAAGTYLVPPVRSGEPFPGAALFAG
jgi:deferrochelatase/peroxidase EfeB